LALKSIQRIRLGQGGYTKGDAKTRKKSREILDDGISSCYMKKLLNGKKKLIGKKKKEVRGG